MGTQEKWIESLPEEIERENEKKLNPEESKYSPYDEWKAETSRNGPSDCVFVHLGNAISRLLTTKSSTYSILKRENLLWRKQ